jgi:hypothetical protein
MASVSNPKVAGHLAPGKVRILLAAGLFQGTAEGRCAMNPTTSASLASLTIDIHYFVYWVEPN